MNSRKNLLLGIIVVITVLLIAIGVSYAYFSANLSGGEDSTTITVTGGTMNIIYNGGANINVANLIPSDNPVITKIFTVTGNNTTDVEMKYQLSLVIESNTFSYEALKYKLISINTGSNGTVVPSINTLTNIGSGAKTIVLGIGEFTSPTNGNKVHTYNLEIYFPNTGTNQNIDQDKEINAYIKIKNYVFTPTMLDEAILAQGGGTAAIEAKGAPDFNVINGVSGLYATEDEYGTSYYYRGLKTELNNNVIWGGFQWKIMRINGDGSIRLIYNGTEEDFNLNGTVNDIGENTHIGKNMWNPTNRNDAKYVGYMYGGTNGVGSTVRSGTTSEAATFNETSNNVKLALENWYLTNIQNKNLDDQVVDNLFCNDRQLQSEVGGEPTGPGYGSTVERTYYAAYYRLVVNKIPTLKCGLKNDRFTVNDNGLGNANLTYPIGSITADEATMAGLKAGESTSYNYLYTNLTFWTLSPADFTGDVSGYAYVYQIRSTGNLTTSSVNITVSYGTRPVISISSNKEVTGNGSATNPFRVAI